MFGAGPRGKFQKMACLKGLSLNCSGGASEVENERASRHPWIPVEGFRAFLVRRELSQECRKGQILSCVRGGLLHEAREEYASSFIEAHELYKKGCELGSEVSCRLQSALLIPEEKPYLPPE